MKKPLDMLKVRGWVGYTFNKAEQIGCQDTAGSVCAGGEGWTELRGGGRALSL